MRMPFADAAFDAVTVGFGLRNMESWGGAAAEMARVLRPGGRLFVLDFSLPKSAAVRSAYRFYLHRWMPAIGGLITGRREAYEYLCQSIEKFPSGGAMCDLLKANGFSAASAHSLSFGIASIYEAER
jgi:demethylmenaquinone methyltransferase/2-methoxy-6-polyprenyl-1,4-benzoquinol methylase